MPLPQSILHMQLGAAGGQKGELRGESAYIVRHQSVLTEEVVRTLALKKGDTVLDATAGQGGHGEALLSSAAVRLIAFDADPQAVAFTRARLARFGSRALVLKANFADLEKVLKKEKIPQIDKALFDLGWNRGQLTSGRGFSFERDEPLSMSFGEEPRSGFTAAQIVNTWSEQALADAFFGYGGERRARPIARKIVDARAQRPLETTADLVRAVEAAAPRRGRIHPATRVFQALRIAVNDELESLKRGLAGAWRALSPEGRLAVISFHSLEDRIVKNFFAELARDGEGTLITKKPMTPSLAERMENRASRSAKLRAIEKRRPNDAEENSLRQRKQK